MNVSGVTPQTGSFQDFQTSYGSIGIPELFVSLLIAQHVSKNSPACFGDNQDRTFWLTRPSKIGRFGAVTPRNVFNPMILQVVMQVFHVTLMCCVSCKYLKSALKLSICCNLLILHNVIINTACLCEDKLFRSYKL